MNTQIRVKVNEEVVVFELNSSRAARDLLVQLPLEVPVKDFGGNEKIFYPPEKLRTDDTPRADAKKGTLAYYAPWGNVVMFYKDFGSAPGLYALGQAVSGAGFIGGLSGTIRIETVPPRAD